MKITRAVAAVALSGVNLLMMAARRPLARAARESIMGA